MPGIGAQGGDVATVVRAGRDKNNRGLIINSSRAILYADNSKTFADSARKIALETRNTINSARFEG